VLIVRAIWNLSEIGKRRPSNGHAGNASPPYNLSPASPHSRHGENRPKAIDTVMIFAYHLTGMTHVIQLNLWPGGGSPPHGSAFQIFTSPFASIRVIRGLIVPLFSSRFLPSFLLHLRQPKPDVSGRKGWGGLKSIPDNQQLTTTPSEPSSGFDFSKSNCTKRHKTSAVCAVMCTCVRPGAPLCVKMKKSKNVHKPQTSAQAASNVEQPG
jgi:hypothetical protein